MKTKCRRKRTKETSPNNRPRFFAHGVILMCIITSTAHNHCGLNSTMSYTNVVIYSVSYPSSFLSSVSGEVVLSAFEVQSGHKSSTLSCLERKGSFHNARAFADWETFAFLDFIHLVDGVTTRIFNALNVVNAHVLSRNRPSRFLIL